MTKNGEQPRRVLIVEESTRDREQCATILSEMAPRLKYIPIGNANAALDDVRRHEPDAVFLSVELCEAKGYHLLDALRGCRGGSRIPVVFMGYHPEKALEMFTRYHCYAYLEKPLEPDGVRDSVGSLIQELAFFNDGEEVKRERRYVHLKTADGFVLIPIQDILFAESWGHETTVTTLHSVYAGLRVQLGVLVGQMEQEGFARCHRSFAVNLRQIVRVQNENPRLRTIHFAVETQNPCLWSTKYFQQVQTRLKELGRFPEPKACEARKTDGHEIDADKMQMRQIVCETQ